MMQEQFSSAVGGGVTHISHIETDNSIPSLQVTVDIINALSCSADELLRVDAAAARPYLNSWLVQYCTNHGEQLMLANVDGMAHNVARAKAEGV